MRSGNAPIYSTAFGVEKNPDESDTNPFRYCGEYWDKETESIYLRARYYNPTIGRFITEDNFVGYQGVPLSINYYIYCYNNPVNLVDPTGFDSYIFYDDTAKSGDGIHTFKDEAEIRAKQLRKKYGTPVWLIGVRNAKSFKKKWNSQVGYGAFGNRVSIDEVAIIAHGSADGEKGAGIGYMYFDSDYSKVAAAKGDFYDSENDVLVSDLDPKTMDSLYFSTCNSGNPDILNLAYAFNKHMIINNSITAWDGGTIFNYETEELEPGAYSIWPLEMRWQGTYYKYVDKTWYGKPLRKRQGKVIIFPKVTPQIPWFYFNKY